MQNALALDADLAALPAFQAPTQEIVAAQRQALAELKYLASPAGTPLERRAAILRLEAALLEFGDRVGPEPLHHFADGLYGRELRRPAGTLVVGRIHRKEHLLVCSEGEIMVFSEFGTQRLKAPATIVGKPGTKRVTLALADTTLIAISATRETDVDKCVEELTTASFDDVPLLDAGGLS